MYSKCSVLGCFSRVRLFVTPWTVARQREHGIFKILATESMEKDKTGTLLSGGGCPQGMKWWGPGTGEGH